MPGDVERIPILNLDAQSLDDELDCDENDVEGQKDEGCVEDVQRAKHLDVQ